MLDWSSVGALLVTYSGRFHIIMIFLVYSWYFSQIIPQNWSKWPSFSEYLQDFFSLLVDLYILKYFLRIPPFKVGVSKNPKNTPCLLKPGLVFERGYPSIKNIYRDLRPPFTISKIFWQHVLLFLCNKCNTQKYRCGRELQGKPCGKQWKKSFFHFSIWKIVLRCSTGLQT